MYFLKTSRTLRPPPPVPRLNRQCLNNRVKWIWSCKTQWSALRSFGSLFRLLRTGLLSEYGKCFTSVSYSLFRIAALFIIEFPDDLFYLYLTELDDLARGKERPWRRLIAERRAAYNRELSRNQIPRLLLSDGRAFYDGMIAGELDTSKLIGSPVSPGTVSGAVRVVLDPLKADLSPGEIMVCPGTDPAWTPLFLTAGGLVMEIGGMMTHGAIVAREYGIPAIVGVHQATTTLETGQNITLDGSTGEIFLADD